MSFRDKTIFIAGAGGMVGRALVRRLEADGYGRLLTPSRDELDLTDQTATRNFFKNNKIDAVLIAAAKVGGILANDKFRAEFLYDNLMIEANVIDAAWRSRVGKLIFLGSSCIYPRMAEQPMSEEALLTGPLEQTNEPYAIAKIAGIKLCENYYRQYGANFFSAMPTNLYGPYDNFDLESSHVIPALMRKFHEAKAGSRASVEIWGSGKPRREFLFVDDLADAIVFLLENVEAAELYDAGVSHINIGTGGDVSISELAAAIGRLTEFEGELVFDPTLPDGTPRKLMDVSRMTSLGWKYQTDLTTGLRATYDWFLTR